MSRMNNKIECKTGDLSYTDRRGVGAEADVGARFAAEAERVAALINGAAIPEACGPGIVAAPARGAFVAEHQVTMVPGGVDAHGLTKWVHARTGYGHRASVRAVDVFDRMILSAGRGRRPSPLTPGQIAMGRRYAGLVELLASDGVKLSTFEGTYGSGNAGSWMDRRLALAADLDGLRKRIGPGVAMSVRRVRPSDRGVDQRGPILSRVLVDMVCIKGQTLDGVLLAHGWVRNGRTRKAALEALSAALDRMIGYAG